ncbi:MAG: glycosyltransferase [Polyangiales bacterium]
MKIVDVAEFYAERGGGVRIYVEQKLKAAAQLGHELVVIAPGERDAIEQRGSSRIAWVASPPLPVDPRYHLLLRERAVHALIDQELPDIIEGSSPWTGGLFAARYRGSTNGSRRVRKVFVFHQDPVAVYPQTLLGGWLGEARVDALCSPYWHYLRRLSGRFDATIVGGGWLAERLHQHGLARPITVPFGVDKALFGSARRDPGLRAELIDKARAEPGASLLVTVSRHHPEKRLGTLLDAVKLLAARRPLALVVYGDGPFATCSALRARGLPVYLAGATRDRALLARVLASGDALLHGSAAETFGLVVAEALCAGLPLVVPSSGGAADLANPAYAETYPAGDARACAAAIERLLDRDRTSLRVQALRAAEHHILSPQEHFQHLFATYAALLQEERPLAHATP